MDTKAVVAAYIGNFIVWGIWLWMQYLDVRTTMKGIALGAVESNPAMIPYVKAGDPWLMVRGKIKNGAWVGFIAPFIPLFAPWLAYLAWDCWAHAVHTNEQLVGKLK